MLDIISNGFKQAKEALSGKTTLSEENIKDALKSIRESLLEADVEYGVVKDFISSVEEQAIGQVVTTKAGSGSSKLKVSASDHFVNICQKELEDLMGPESSGLNFAVNRPTVIMMIGLQGSGKTTTTAKIAKYLKEQQKKKPLLAAADIYRPAAVEQLKVLGKKIDSPVHHSAGEKPLKICQDAIKAAYTEGADVVILDTAGRLTVDEQLMNELSEIANTIKPDEILLVCDAMMGQDAVTTASAFHGKIGITGFVMTKLDGDARGGAALSIKKVTGKPIKFLGIGEELTGIEVFRPQGLASRILGMGDIVGLMQDFEKVSTEDQEAEALKMLQGQFSFKDFYQQISMIQKMGSLKDIAAKLPMQNMIPKDANFDDKELTKVKSMIDSMTELERLKPAVFNPSRVKRIAKGSGRSEKDVNDLLGKFRTMRQMMGGLGKSMGLLGKIPGMNALSGLNKLRKMAGGLGGGGGGMPDLQAMMQQMQGGGATLAPKKTVDRDKLKKLRKAAKKSRKKNRKR